MRSSWIGLILVGLLCSSTLAVEAGELIRYRRSDGSVGFAGSASSIPPGAVILTRERTSQRGRRAGAKAEVPEVESLVAGVRSHCSSAYPRGGSGFDSCMAHQTQSAFEFRDLVVEQRSGTQASQIVASCRRRLERGSGPNYAGLLECIEQGQAEFEARTGQHPAELDLDRRDDMRDDSLDQKRRAAKHRLRRMRDDQAAAERELAIGRDKWGPRYRKAEREYHDARERTESILQRMRDRGCRANTLACGSLGPKLEAARRNEEKKRRYLEVDLVEKCRLAGCKPGWLR